MKIFTLHNISKKQWVKDLYLYSGRVFMDKPYTNMKDEEYYYAVDYDFDSLREFYKAPLIYYSTDKNIERKKCFIIARTGFLYLAVEAPKDKNKTYLIELTNDKTTHENIVMYLGQ